MFFYFKVDPVPAETAFKCSSGTLTPLASQAEAPFQAFKIKLPFIRDNWDENLWRKGHLRRRAGGFGFNVLVDIHITFPSCQQKWKARSEQMHDCLCVCCHIDMFRHRATKDSKAWQIWGQRLSAALDSSLIHITTGKVRYKSWARE